METGTLAMAQEIDFSLFALFARATITVKVVMIGLMVMSFWSWSIITRKHIMFRKARAEAAVFDREFWSGEPLDGLFEKIGGDPQGPSEKIFSAGMLEWRRSHRQDGGPREPAGSEGQHWFFGLQVDHHAHQPEAQ